MNFVKIHYGLGNQLFQYAFARALGLKKNQPVKLDISFYEGRDYTDGDAPRGYKLNNYNIEVELASKSETQLYREPNFIRRKIITLSRVFAPAYSPKFWEQSICFDDRVYKMKGTTYYHGYWQDERYFKSIKDILYKELTLKENPSGVYKDKIKEISSCNSVCVHIRRGDYLTSNYAVNALGILNLSYYMEAIDHIAKKVENPQFFIFSDDYSWCKEHIKIKYPTSFIEPDLYGVDYEDLRLMSHCKHHIIANSSFSWWGAWLAKNESKIVVAPKNWYRDGTQRCLPPEWILK